MRSGRLALWKGSWGGGPFKEIVHLNLVVLSKAKVFDEPHKKYNSVTGTRERHKHLIFKLKTTFAHLKIQKAFAAKGVYGHFSFNLVGYVQYLRYCMVASAKKLQADLDLDPWSWPPASSPSLLAICDTPTPQQDARNGFSTGRKRKLLTFSEITDAFVEGKVRTEKDAWQLAKNRKVSGDETLWNSLGASVDVAALVTKVRTAWECENITGGTLVTKPDYMLNEFIAVEYVSDDLPWWLNGGWKTHSLILSGTGGLGKTELACALMHSVSPGGSFHFINKVDRLRDVTFSPGEGLVVDEACFSDRDIDDIKNLLDLEKNRDVDCRNRDGHIPKMTPRIFSTNWCWDVFWPSAVWSPMHAHAINRRHLWVDVRFDLRAPLGTENLWR